MLDIGIYGVCKEFPMGKQLIQKNRKIILNKNLGKKMMMIPGGGVTLCRSWNLVRLMFLQLIPACIVDGLMKYRGKRGGLVDEVLNSIFKVYFRRLMKIQRKMYEANKALAYFVTHNWNFKNDNFSKLGSYLKPEDKHSFDYRRFFTFDTILYIRLTVYGFRKYLLNLKDEDLEKDRKFIKNLDFVMNSVEITFLLLVFYLFVKCCT